MTVKFTVSAPGKVILNGEHSVVYNKPALAGVIGLRNSVTFTENDSDVISINFDLFSNASIKYQVSTINDFFKEISSKFNAAQFPEDLATLHAEYLASVRQFVQTKTDFGAMNDNEKSIVEKAVTAVLYLLTALETHYAAYYYIEPQLKCGFTLDFQSQIPTGAGLGSSAAYGVCVAGVFYVYTLTHSKPDFVKNFKEKASDEEKTYFKNTVSAWAYLSERIMHGTPSGLDNTVCTFGNVVQFTKNPQKFVDVNLRSKLNIMLVNTGVSRNTLEVVQRVRNLRDDHNQLIDNILDAMGALVQDVVEIMENDKSALENYEQLKRLYTINNNLLRALGVSHPVLEEIFAISEKLGFGCKLTGAGAGGFAIVLLPPSYGESEAFRALSTELSRFAINVTTIGGSGLEVTE